MAREKLPKSLVLKICLLVAALCFCVCIQVYLEPVRWARPLLSSGRPARGSRLPPAPGQLSHMGRGTPTVSAGGGERGGSSEPKGGDAATKRQVTYVRALKRDAEAVREAGGGGDRVTSCCPLPHPHKKVPRWHIDLQPWATPSHSLEDEAIRFLKYIQTPQMSCDTALGPAPPGSPREQGGPWLVCLDDRFSLVHRIRSKQCRVYSLGLGMEDKQLEGSLAKAGCEVHCFDPSIKQAHLQDSDMWHHRLSVDWRDPNPAIPAQQQHSNTKKLATILNDFGHRKIDVLKADMESAEWKILENLILEDVLEDIGQLLLEVHLHWPGFEVNGDDSTVVRYWYSLLRELERHHFHLFYSHSDISKPRLFLHRNLFNASSSYTLGWVNTRWRP
ncbi:methyltransferase-like protein 24 [Megalops cyprinoides]|uniref:methyltransferase-like protein 24 n=1 Tax=Megalops cyprinoides TaxID=118141 RepID=UPI00186532BB|nr:methyltransferase-like protein 24 [Megalops cyprinoides]